MVVSPEDLCLDDAVLCSGLAALPSLAHDFPPIGVATDELRRELRGSLRRPEPRLVEAKLDCVVVSLEQDGDRVDLPLGSFGSEASAGVVAGVVQPNGDCS